MTDTDDDMPPSLAEEVEANLAIEQGLGHRDRLIHRTGRVHRDHRGQTQHRAKTRISRGHRSTSPDKLPGCRAGQPC